MQKFYSLYGRLDAAKVYCLCHPIRVTLDILPGETHGNHFC
jgi:hypothetical protein